jgi:beta-glucosidase
MRTTFLFISLWMFSMTMHSQTPVYLDESKPLEQRVEDALQRLTMEEKLKLCHAQSKFSSSGVPRLGIPELWMSDGPHGIREEVLWDEWLGAGWTTDSCMAFPALTCLAASWNTEMAALFGKSIGEEARYRKKDVLLGPGVNIYRTPLNGRNFEYMGEDPCLASTMVVPYVHGVQSNGVAACVKHFALNNQERYRSQVNVVVGDRALHEIYLPAFRAAVQEGGAWAIMGSYNRYRNQFCCHNQYLLNDILKRDWHFDGVVISDWGGAHDTDQAAYNGLDLEMGTWTDGLTWGQTDAYDNYYLARPLLEKIQSGEMSPQVVDDKVRRILRTMFRTVMNTKRPWGSFGTEEHARAGREIAQEGIVLLKNERNVLPVDLSRIRKIAVIGENAVKPMTIGGGSSSLKAKYEVSPLDGLKALVGDRATIVYAEGYASPLTARRDPPLVVPNGYVAPDPALLRQQALEAARDADIVLFFGGLNKYENQDAEGDDRTDYHLLYGQDELISALAKAHKNLVVTLISGNAVAMPWIKDVPAIVQGWYGGAESGNAIASVLLGDVNPSGKLPMTFAVQLEDYPSHSLGEYPGDSIDVHYNEGIYVGYRHFDRQKINPLFAFGHGLSYTTFRYGAASLSARTMTGNETITLSVPVSNIGRRAGKEVVQVYVGDEKSSLERPVKELKAFRKISLAPGEEQVVEFQLSVNDLKFYDDSRQEWVAEPGAFKVYVGSSSTDIRCTAAFVFN